MKKLVLAHCSPLCVRCAAAEKSTLASPQPIRRFESMDANNQIVGFDIDLAHALCKQSAGRMYSYNHAFDRLIPALKFRNMTVISGMDITPERSKQVPSPTRTMKTRRRDRQKDAFHSFDDLKGKRIGMETAPPTRNICRISILRVKTVAYDSYQNAIIDLKNGRIDGVFGDTAVVNEWLKTNPQLGQLRRK